MATRKTAAVDQTAETAAAEQPVKTAARKPAAKPVARKMAAKPSEKAVKQPAAKKPVVGNVRSMTGFANQAAETVQKRINLELRAVNHRYLDVQFRMPEELRFLEGELRELIAAAVARGKLECRIQVQDIAAAEQSVNVNQDLVAQLAQLNKQWRKQYDLAKLSVAEVLHFPGVLAGKSESTETLAAAVKDLLARTLKDFDAARLREGKKLGQHLLQRLEAMTEIVDGLSGRFPQLLEAHMEKVRSRLQEAVGNIDNERLQQEFALFIQKADVDEEFSRLKTHIAEVRRIVGEGKGGIGKRLDFLMQELNREANTLGSKAIAAECTQASVELKVLIEQMREQVQNIE